MREFMFLRATRRAGVDPEADLPARSLAVWCPACPQPGMNMDPNWQNRKPKDEYACLLLYRIPPDSTIS